MVILRIRQAETALADGRLDEAYVLARRDDVRAHRHGQRLIGSLVRALLSRGRDHLDAGRPQEALSDCEKAQRLGGGSPEVMALRSEAEEAIRDRQRAERRKADALAAARKHADRGELTMAEGVLGEMAEGGTRKDALVEELAARRQSAEGSLARAEAAMAGDDWATALDELARARRRHGGSGRVADLLCKATAEAHRRIRSSIEAGRLDRADRLLCKLQSLSEQNLETQELAGIMAQCQLAGEWIDQGKPRRAAEVLRKLQAVLPEATWIDQALAGAQQAAEGIESLRGGPIGLLSARKNIVQDEPRRPESPVSRTQPLGSEGTGAQGSPANRFPDRFLIHMDGIGSFLVLCGRRIEVGPTTSSLTPDVPLLVERGLPTATIERCDEDYFLTADDPVRVNGKQTHRILLGGGEKIELSRRCRLRFARPHPASTSAVLDLAGMRLPGTDARRVILMDRSIVIGPGASAHVRVDDLTAPMILKAEGDGLTAKVAEPMTADGDPLDPRGGLPMGERLCVGPVAFVVTKT